MAKELLTATGVDNKRAEIYALPKIDVLAEADAVESDPHDWIVDNFTLTSTQADYLRDMDQGALKYYGQQLAMCFRHGLDFTLVTPTPPPSYGGKWVDQKNTIECNVNAVGDIEVSGDVTFTYNYRP